jgi:hypothetical protein
MEKLDLGGGRLPAIELWRELFFETAIVGVMFFLP